MDYGENEFQREFELEKLKVEVRIKLALDLLIEVRNIIQDNDIKIDSFYNKKKEIIDLSNSIQENLSDIYDAWYSSSINC